MFITATSSPLLQPPSHLLSASEVLDIAEDPFQYSFRFCEENDLFPDDCLAMIRDILDVIYGHSTGEVSSATGILHDANNSGFTVHMEPAISFPFGFGGDGREGGGSQLYTLLVYPNQRVEDAVDDYLMSMNISAMLHTDKEIPPYSAEYIRDALLGAFRKSSTDNSPLASDGAPPRDIIGVWSFLENHYHANSYEPDDDSGRKVDAQYFYRYNIRSGYKMDFHINYICNLLAYSKLLCQAKSGYIKEQIEKEIKLFQIYKGNDNSAVGISIGIDCGAALIGTQYNFRKRKKDGYLTGPFDLIISSYEGIIQCLQDDFKYFLDEDYLQVIEVKKGFDEYNFPIHNWYCAVIVYYLLTFNLSFSLYSLILSLYKMTCSHFRKGDKFLINTKYKFVFVHESPATYHDVDRINSHFGEVNDSIAMHWPDGPETFLKDGFKRFKSRYLSRIANFRAYLNGGKLINFLYHDIFSPLSFPRLDLVMKEMYPHTNYKVTLIPGHVSKYSQVLFWNNVLSITTGVFVKF